jgi:hypothetical protein
VKTGLISNISATEFSTQNDLGKFCLVNYESHDSDRAVFSIFSISVSTRRHSESRGTLDRRKSDLIPIQSERMCTTPCLFENSYPRLLELTEFPLLLRDVPLSTFVSVGSALGGLISVKDPEPLSRSTGKPC